MEKNTAKLDNDYPSEISDDIKNIQETDENQLDFPIVLIGEKEVNHNELFSIFSQTNSKQVEGVELIPELDKVKFYREAIRSVDIDKYSDEIDYIDDVMNYYQQKYYSKVTDIILEKAIKVSKSQHNTTTKFEKEFEDIDVDIQKENSQNLTERYVETRSSQRSVFEKIKNGIEDVKSYTSKISIQSIEKFAGHKINQMSKFLIESSFKTIDTISLTKLQITENYLSATRGIKLPSKAIKDSVKSFKSNILASEEEIRDKSKKAKTTLTNIAKHDALQEENRVIQKYLDVIKELAALVASNPNEDEIIENFEKNIQGELGEAYQKINQFKKAIAKQKTVINENKQETNIEKKYDNILSADKTIIEVIKPSTENKKKMTNLLEYVVKDKVRVLYESGVDIKKLETLSSKYGIKESIPWDIYYEQERDKKIEYYQNKYESFLDAAYVINTLKDDLIKSVTKDKLSFNGLKKTIKGSIVRSKIKIANYKNS